MPNKTGPFACDFNSLSPEELYEILRARVNVFVVEQNCPYPELDGIDYISTHVFIREGRDLPILDCLVFSVRIRTGQGVTAPVRRSFYSGIGTERENRRSLKMCIFVA